ncbi:unnamed protein product [Jaminaea pallidilutea]
MDDLLDLDWNKGSSATRGKGSDSASGSSRQGNGWSASASSTESSSYNFDALTRSLPPQRSLEPQRRVTPNRASPAPSSRAPTPNRQQPSSSANDAFSSLLSLGSNSSNGAKPSTASSLADQQRATTSGGTSTQNDGWDSLDGWDAFESSSSSSSKPAPVARPAASSPAPAPAPASAPRARSQPPISSVKDPFDFSDFEDPGASQTSAFGGDDLRPPQPTFGDESEEDFLGALGRPVPNKSTQSAAEEEPRAAARPRPQSKPRHQSRPQRSVSPPPHLLGQIVEMGFSPQQAREALAATPTGLDVQAALDSLLGGQGGAASSQQRHEEEDRRMAMRMQNDEHRDIEMEEYEERERRRRAARSQSRREAAGEAPPSRAGAGGAAPAAENDWQKQADLLYSQASELGANVFSRANAFWSQAKAQAQKTLEEQRSATNSGRGTPDQQAGEASSSGRGSPASWARRLGGQERKPKADWQAGGKPRWMVEAEAAGEESTSMEAESAPGAAKAGKGASSEATGGFKDSDNEDEQGQPPASFLGQATRHSAKQSPTPTPSAARLDVHAPPAARFKAEQSQASPPKAYVSSARWGRSKATPAAAAPAAQTSTKSKPPPPKSSRSIAAEDSQPYPSRAASHKERGNEAFKKGAYGDAEASYTAALDALGSQTSLRRVPLLNNRANAKIKNGDASGAAHDSTTVIELIAGGKSNELWRPSREEALPAALASEVNLRDSYGKALLRRAQASETMERYVPALKDWERLVMYEREEGSGAANGVRNMRAGKDGIQRCRNMMGGKEKKAGLPTKTPAAARASVSAVARAEEAGRQRVRAQAAAQAAEDLEAHSLKDSVDARILAWSAGKETNIRALLTSLDMVVWEGLGWKKVGMNEVLTEPQVKKVYTKAIARLHPDKLIPSRTTLEQRLMGKEVFRCLNEAFAASQGG